MTYTFDMLLDSDGKRWEPIMPKEGTVKSAVLHLMMAHPGGICRRDAANMIDVYELSNRIGELQADGWTIWKGRCERHGHRQRFTLYSL
jgi:hypothetical protein